MLISIPLLVKNAKNVCKIKVKKKIIKNLGAVVSGLLKNI